MSLVVLSHLELILGGQQCCLFHCFFVHAIVLRNKPRTSAVIVHVVP